MSARRVLWSTAFILSAGLSLTAQSAPQTVDRVPLRPADPTAPVTVTGCLKAWVEEKGEPATSAAESRADVAPRFTLTQLKQTPAPVAAAAVADGSPKPAEIRLLLVPATTVDLAAHVNTTVTVSGTMMPEGVAARPIGTSGQQPASNSNGGAPAAAAPPSSSEAHRYETMSVSAVVATANGCSLQ